MPDQPLQPSGALTSTPAPTESMDDIADLVRELEQQWQAALNQNCNPSQLKELCCLTPLLTGDGVPDRVAVLAREIDIILRTHIEARSVPEAKDRQSVTADLVRLKACVQGQELAGSPQLPAAPANASLVYIITDDPAQGQYLALQVAAHGFETRILTDPTALRETVLTAPPGALIADIAAGKSIIEAVGAIKQAVAGFLPVVFIASQSDARTRLAALRAGGDAYFTRPVPVPELVAKLRELTGDRQRPLRVLMVDDDRAILELYGGQLRGAGFQVHTLSDPWAVLEAAVEFQPELILLDLYMPEVDGFEISHLLRQEERFLNIPIVFLSGERDFHKQTKAFDAGAFDFLVKPVKPGQLIELVRARATQYRRLSDKVQYLGKTDPVTGLYNRHYFTNLLGDQLQHPAKGSIRALLFMELDRMPQADASPGEVESLNLLRTKVARMINDHLVSGDLAAAYSEGVFTVLAEREDLAALEALAEALRRGVESIQISFRGGTLDPCASIGLSRAGDNARRAISDAALACSLARLAGGNTVRLQDDLKDRVQDQEQRQYWMKQIGDAVKEQRLFLVYQPIASLVAENLERFEVLLRIRDESGQTVLPGQFMEMARQLSLTRLLDRWVVSQALSNLALQQQTKPQTTFFIKLATETLLEKGFMDWLTKSIDRHKIHPGSCVFEFPEGDLRSQPAVNHSLIKRLQSMSIGLAIEHFSGSEQALGMLDTLPVNYVKLDRNLVHNLPECPERQKAVRGIIDKARTRGIRTVAAYVEDAASLSLLWQYRIDLIQGFFLQQPHEVARYDIAI